MAELADMGSRTPTPSQTVDPSIWSYLATLMRRPGLMLGLPLLLGAVAGTASLLQTREYVAFASFVPQDVGGLQSNIGQLASQFGLLPARASSSPPQFYADLLLSRDILRAVITSEYSSAGPKGFHGTLLDYFGLDGRDAERAFTDAVPKLLLLVNVGADKTTGIIRLQVRSRDPGLSRQVARKFVTEVISFNQRRRQTTGQAEREFVEERLLEARRDLANAEDELADFYQRNRRVADSPRLVSDEARLQRQVSMRQQVYIALYQSLQAARLEAARTTPVVTEIDRPEGYVQRRARGTVRNTILGFLAGIVIATLLAFGREYVTGMTAAAPEDYAEFVALSRAVVDSMRKSLRGRHLDKS